MKLVRSSGTHRQVRGFLWLRVRLEFDVLINGLERNFAANGIQNKRCIHPGEQAVLPRAIILAEVMNDFGLRLLHNYIINERRQSLIELELASSVIPSSRFG